MERGSWGEKSGPVPQSILLDWVFREYGWTYQEWLQTPFALWEELLIILKAKGDAESLKTKAKTPGTTEDLIATAMQEGFEVPPEVLREYQKGRA